MAICSTTSRLVFLAWLWEDEDADVHHVRLVFSRWRKGIVSEPTDRTAAIKGLIEKAGGKLIAAYMTTGTNDIVIIAEIADGSDAIAAGMAAAASGHLEKVETVRAWTLAEFKEIAEKSEPRGRRVQASWGVEAACGSPEM